MVIKSYETKRRVAVLLRMGFRYTQKGGCDTKKRYADRMYNPTIEEMWLLYCKLARQYFPEKFATILCEDSRHKKRRQKMIDELKPFIEQFGFEVEDDEEDIDVYEDESLSPTNDYIITMPSWDEVPF